MMSRRRDNVKGVWRWRWLFYDDNRDFLYVATVLCSTCVIGWLSQEGALLSVRFPKGKLSDQTVHSDCRWDRIRVSLHTTLSAYEYNWIRVVVYKIRSLSKLKEDGKVFLFSITHIFSLWEDGEGWHIADLISLPMHVGHYYRACVYNHINIMLCNSIESVRHQYS